MLDKWMTYVSPNHRGCQVTIYKEWEQTLRPAFYKTDTAIPHLAMPGFFSSLAWLSCLLPLSDVGATSLDWAGSVSECQTDVIHDTGGVKLGLDKTRTNLPGYCAELKCLKSEHRERKTLITVFELKLDSDANVL